jgi:hypothetical protein
MACLFPLLPKVFSQVCPGCPASAHPGFAFVPIPPGFFCLPELFVCLLAPILDGHTTILP